MYGISLDSLVLPKIKVDQLYIKLDKKLIVTIQSLEINAHTQTDTSLEESTQIIQSLPYLNQFFKHISIQNLIYANERIALYYAENQFELTSQHLDVKLMLTPYSKTALDVTILEANFKDFFLHVKGNAHLDLKAENYRFEGAYDTFGLKGSTRLELQKNLLSYHVQSEPFTNQALSDFMNFLSPIVELEPLAKDWIHTNIVGQEYILEFLEGQLDIQTLDYFPMQMRGHATVKDATISFEPSVPPAFAKQIGITLHEDKLLFDVLEPYYEQKEIQQADVYIYNLLTKGTGIVVDLNATATLDASIHKILHAFKIDVPITQTSGKTEAHVKLDIKFLPYDINATGEFKLSPSTFNLSGLPMATRSGEVLLDNYRVTLNRANLQYKNLFDIDTTGIFETKTSDFNGSIDIRSLLLKFGEMELLKGKNLKHQKASFTIDKNTTTMRLPGLETNIIFEPKNNQFIFNDLSKIAPISPFMYENGIEKGSVKVTTQDFESFLAKLNLYDVSTPFLTNGIPVKDFDITLTTNTKTLDAYTSDYALALHLDKEIALHVKNLDLLVPNSTEPLNIPIKTTLYGENSSIIDANSSRTILSNRYTLSLFKDTVHLESKKGTASFSYQKKDNQLTLHAQAMDDESINALFNHSYFHQGTFELSLEPTTLKTTQGVFKMHNTFIKDLKFFNNLMATINTIPSLLVFSDPNFSKEGYFVETGTLIFEQNEDTLNIKEFQLRGKNADITGKGSVDLHTDALDLKLRVKTLKTFSSAIDFIPLVGGLILGEDKRISTNVDVKGTLDEPNIETHLLLDTLKSPVNILKRTLEAPLELLK